MKMRNVKHGQIVVDKHGNEYEIFSIDRSTSMSVILKCTKFCHRIDVQEDNVGFRGVGQTFWVYKSKAAARKDGCDVMNILTVDSLKPKGE